jgi:hypothetical protein
MSAYMNHGSTAPVKMNSGLNSALAERASLRRIVLKNHRTTAAQVTAELSIHLEDPISAEAVQLELHKSNICSRAAVAKPLITESNAQMCHNCRIWTSDNWKCACEMVR